MEISRGFDTLWNFPHCLGAIDGKHIAIQAPTRCGSEFYNYKGFHSIVLMAVCDATYKFTVVNIGDSGSHSGGGVFANSAFGKALNNNLLSLPEASLLGNGTEPVPYCFVADAAFPLKKNLMRPYPGQQLPEDKRGFNYRLSRVRRVIENSFGILSARWRIFKRPIISSVENAVLYTKTACSLHNFLQTNYSESYCPSTLVDLEKEGSICLGSWKTETSSNLRPIGQTASNNYSATAGEVRDILKTFFTSTEGALSWQLSVVNRNWLESEAGWRDVSKLSVNDANTFVCLLIFLYYLWRIKTKIV